MVTPFACSTLEVLSGGDARLGDAGCPKLDIATERPTLDGGGRQIYRIGRIRGLIATGWHRGGGVAAIGDDRFYIVLSPVGEGDYRPAGATGCYDEIVGIQSDEDTPSAGGCG